MIYLVFYGRRYRLFLLLLSFFFLLLLIAHPSSLTLYTTISTRLRV